ncbi:fimbrial protein [Burkholderia sp. Nafp2/4-1b]|uniref:fimbrial protein n=1 Tax=Burkholderia sp. Nafp2/4-1b TaxID=2116686 RepID=UPI000EF95FC3|nr:fimbrial protein [Burkholderia sp. Nafp2/4-1b]RKU05030.1 fimbrial protein [Burkholderia sp. Nafp2/4-1b]
MTYLYSSSEAFPVASRAGIACMRDARGSVARRTGRMIAIASALLLACAAFATDAAAEGPLYAFGQATVASPSTATPGMVVARHYFTPQEACGKSTCEINEIIMYTRGAEIQSPGPDLETVVSGLSTRMLIDGNVVVAGTRPITLRNTLEVTLFRDSRLPKNGSLSSSRYDFYYSLYYKSGVSSKIFLAAKVGFINGTCSVPDQTVMLPSVMYNAFNGVGSTAGATDFQLRLNNCPAGYNRIGYQLEPLDDVIVGTPGAIQLRPDSTASGVGLQLTDGTTGQPLVLRRSLPVTGYNPATGGSPSIPLRAAYLQTGAQVGTGSVHAAAQILIDYQ